MTVGASTEALAGEGMIVTAGGLDTHIHFIAPQQVNCALYSGVTTMIGRRYWSSRWNKCYNLYARSLEYGNDVKSGGRISNKLGIFRKRKLF